MEKTKDSKYAVVGLIILALFVGYFWGKWSISKNPTEYIFDSKTFFDNNKTGNFQSVYVAGTLTGEGQNGNNTTAITCSKEKMTCLVNSIEGISENTCQLSRLDAPRELAVTDWNNYSITATDETPYDTFSCFKNTININRDSQVVEWVQEPINQSQLSCKDVKDNKIYKWTIEDPTWMKNFKDSLKK